MSFEEGRSRGANFLEVEDRNESFFQFFQLEYAIIADAGIIFFDDLKFVHPMHDVIFLFQFRLRNIGIDFF